ncbi:MAG: hypothetical protein QGH94_17750 [Phycisphaerae bacterium]|jgi:hypothetical protein|nr:hypothetical protein [Phycisphaerae bacterium]
MTASDRKNPKKASPPEPVDVSDEIPDRRPAVSRGVVGVLILLFVGWCAFLLYCQYAGVV